MYKYLIKSTNPLKALWGGGCRYYTTTHVLLVFGLQIFSSDWNYNCGLYVTK